MLSSHCGGQGAQGTENGSSEEAHVFASQASSSSSGNSEEPCGIKFSPSPGAVMPLSTGPGAEFLTRNRNVGLAPLHTAVSHTSRWLEGGGLSKGWKPESTVSLALGTSGQHVRCESASRGGPQFYYCFLCSCNKLN